MGLIPHHPAAPMFANAGMNQFLPIILGEEPVPEPAPGHVGAEVPESKGKHDDIANVGVTSGHLTFFEMLGNFSFGDYFKAEVIPWAWELLTEVLKIDGDRLWVTVHETDDEAAAIWLTSVGLPAERIQRLGADNFWEMGETGPCGPSSEIFFDRGEAFGAPGGPAHGADARFAEIWNLVFMQYNRLADGTLEPLPLPHHRHRRRPGAHADASSRAWTRCSRPTSWPAWWPRPRRPPAGAWARTPRPTSACGSWPTTPAPSPSWSPTARPRPTRTGATSCAASSAAPSATPSGLGVEGPVLPAMVEAVVDVMGDAYPELRGARDDIAGVIGREEERFHRTLRSGSAILDEELAKAGAGGTLAGAVAFRLHDTYGFPLELTLEVAEERGVDVDQAGFEAAMENQRRLGPAGRQAAAPATRPTPSSAATAYKALLEAGGPVEFLGYRAGGGHRHRARRHRRARSSSTARPFYAEGGGQVGDTGTIVSATGRAEVLDTTYALPGLHRHAVRVVEGEITPARRSTATVDTERRERHPPQPHRHPPAPLGPARGARQPRQAGRLPRRAGPPAVRLQPLRGGDAGAARSRSRTWPTTR